MPEVKLERSGDELVSSQPEKKKRGRPKKTDSKKDVEVNPVQFSAVEMIDLIFNQINQNQIWKLKETEVKTLGSLTDKMLDKYFGSELSLETSFIISIVSIFVPRWFIWITSKPNKNKSAEKTGKSWFKWGKNEKQNRNADGDQRDREKLPVEKNGNSEIDGN